MTDSYTPIATPQIITDDRDKRKRLKGEVYSDSRQHDANNLAFVHSTDLVPSQSSPTSTLTLLNPTTNGNTLSTMSPTSPPESSAPTSTYSQDNSKQSSSSRTSTSAPLIAGATCSVLVLTTCALLLWWCLRRRRRQQILSSSKTTLMSARNTSHSTPHSTPHNTPQLSHFAYDLERQQQDLKNEKCYTASDKESFSSQSKIDDILTPPKRATGDSFSATDIYASTLSLPIQLPAFPSPTPRERRTPSNASSILSEDSHIGNTAACTRHVVPRQNTSLPIMLPRTPSATHAGACLTKSCHPNGRPLGITRYPSASSLPEVTAQAGDFYLDMVDFAVDSELRKNLARLRTVATNPGAQTGQLHMSSAPHTPTRPRSPSLPSSHITNGSASPRVSKDARRVIHYFPPPPPPSVPPPAIPEDGSNEGYNSRPIRPRASTTSAVGDSGSSVFPWDPAAPPSPRRSGFSSAKNLVISPPNSPPPVYISLLPLQGSVPSSPREQYHHHRRAQSNVVSTNVFAASLDQLGSEIMLPLPSSPTYKSSNGSRTTTAHSNIPSRSVGQTSSTARPVLRQHKSQGSLDDSKARMEKSYAEEGKRGKGVEEIVLDAVAITEAKKQQQESTMAGPELSESIRHTIWVLPAMDDVLPESSTSPLRVAETCE
ncbi:hypothetical protein EDD21DRAFT_367881 [Dissophora ornata]|nr:hypothetical protein EDD21DRAFT_367881 [Dissophora ornata]